VTVPVEKVACFLPISKEMFEDEPAMRSYAKMRLPTFRHQAEEQVLVSRLERAATQLRVRFYETNASAIARAHRRSEKDGGLVPDFQHVVSRDKLLIGSTQGATFWRKGEGWDIEVSNEHYDYFRKQLYAIRAEAREAVTVFRPRSFVEIKLRTWPRRLRRKLGLAKYTGRLAEW
jgi:hypothetical protein